MHLGGQDRDTGPLADLPSWGVCSFLSNRVLEITTVSTCLVLLLVKVLTNGLPSCKLVYVGGMTLFGPIARFPGFPTTPHMRVPLPACQQRWPGKMTQR
jgi:hypothetical protein